MTQERKEEIIANLQTIYDNFEVPPFLEGMTMFDLVSIYNDKHENPELIGGDWVIKNCPEPMKSLR